MIIENKPMLKRELDFLNKHKDRSKHLNTKESIMIIKINGEFFNLNNYSNFGFVAEEWDKDDVERCNVDSGNTIYTIYFKIDKMRFILTSIEYRKYKVNSLLSDIGESFIGYLQDWLNADLESKPKQIDDIYYWLLWNYFEPFNYALDDERHPCSEVFFKK